MSYSQTEEAQQVPNRINKYRSPSNGMQAIKTKRTFYKISERKYKLSTKAQLY